MGHPRILFIIEDERHAEWQAGQYQSLAEAVAELRRRASLPWDEPPNVAPCGNWPNCGRTYVIVEYDAASTPWRELSRLPYLEVAANAVRWLCPVDA
jgi:hypothetical protein